MVKSRGFLYKEAALLCIVFLLSLLMQTTRVHSTEMVNTVIPAFDGSEYHNLAINLLGGEGYVQGILFDPGLYRYSRELRVPDDICLQVLYPNHDFFRTPGFPLVIAAAYLVFGINPVMIYYLNMVFIASMAVILFRLGKGFGDWRGTFSGVVAASYLSLQYWFQDRIYSESLIVLLIGVWFLALVHFQKEHSKASAAFLGVAVSVLMLVKGSSVFLSVFTAAYILVKDRTSVMGFLTAVVIILAPWSAYANYYHQEPLFLSTEGEQVLYESNNFENSKPGMWNADFSKARDCGHFLRVIYPQNLSSFRNKAISNIAYHPLKALNLLGSKLWWGYWDKRVLPANILFISCLLIGVGANSKTRKRLKINAGILILFMSALSFTVVFFGEFRMVQPYMPLVFLYSFNALVKFGYDMLYCVIKRIGWLQ